MKAGPYDMSSRCAEVFKYCARSGPIQSKFLRHLLQGAKAHLELQANVLALAFVLLALYTWKH